MEGQSSKALVWDAGKGKRKDEREKIFVQGWNSWKELGVKRKDWVGSEHSYQRVAYVPLTHATSTTLSVTGISQRSWFSPAQRQ